MAIQYIYRARTASNQVVTGKVEAASLDVAKKILVKNGLVPLAISAPKSWTEYLPIINKVSLKDKTLFARQLSTMIESGLTLAQSLRLLVRQSKKGMFQRIMVAILNDIEDGFSFSSALAKFPDVFDTVFVNVVRSGEATGKLEAVLQQLATNMEKEVSVRGKITGALFYPAFILIAMVGVGLVMTTQVIPQLKDVFLSSGQNLPAQTLVLIALSDFIRDRWYVVIAGVIAAVAGARYFSRTDFGMRFISIWVLRLPIVGSITEQSSMARLGRLLGMLLGSGVPLLEALKLVNESFTNRLYKQAVVEVAAQVERGIPMSVPISNNKVFPIMVGQMVSVGEQTGKMDEVMVRMAQYYEGEVDAKVAGLASLIEPLVIVVLGIGVAYLVVAILLPVYQMSTNV